MKISLNWLQTYFEKNLPSADELADLFALHAFEIEGIEKAGNDSVLDIKVLPDRAHYDLCHKGIADEISYLTKLSPKNRYVEETKAILEDKPEVKIENPDFCRRYTARMGEIGSNKARSPEWLSPALESIGQRSINPIVDVTNYVMYDIGQPLHAFDADKVVGAISIRPAKEGEKIVLLDGREITLTANDSVIADEEGALVIAGAKGGKRAEVTEATRRIIIESANFDPTAVRRTSTKYDIRSDSSKRFENEISPELAIYGMNNVCALLKEVYPEAKFGPIVDEYPRKPAKIVINFDPAYVEERLGIAVPIVESKAILERMGINIEEKGKVWNLAIPFNRLDLKIREDIVEEIGRVYGYDKIEGRLPEKTSKEPAILPIYFVSEKIRSLLSGAGFSEVSLYTLVEKGEIETLKPLAKDKAFVRNNLSDGMKEAVHRNALNADLLGLDQIRIFEIGHTFGKSGEKIKLAIGASQVKKMKGVKSEIIILDVMKILETEFGSLGSIKPLNPTPQISVIEIDLDGLAAALDKNKISFGRLGFGTISNDRYAKFSAFPFITRDIAVFVPENVEAGAVWNTIKKGIDEAGATDLLARYSLFDTFKKEGKVSYAYRMIFQSMDRTLTDDEVAMIMEKINSNIKENGWEVR